VLLGQATGLLIFFLIAFLPACFYALVARGLYMFHYRYVPETDMFQQASRSMLSPSRLAEMLLNEHTQQRFLSHVHALSAEAARTLRAFIAKLGASERNEDGEDEDGDEDMDLDIDEFLIGDAEQQLLQSMQIAALPQPKEPKPEAKE
jgi:hypothetical protein